MSKISANYDQLALGSQLAKRQGQLHFSNMERHLREWGTLESGDLGLLLRKLAPINDAIVDGGCRALSFGQQITVEYGNLLDRTIESYAATEEENQRVINARMVKLGGTPSAPQAVPVPPALGPAAGGASGSWGEGELGFPFNAGQIADQFAGPMSGFLSEALQKADRLGSPAAVGERNDASSYLTTPVANINEIQDLRWSAGAVLGSIDWVFEKLAGFSLIERFVMEPFAGNWDRLEQASIAWRNVSAAVSAVGDNFAGLAIGLSEWVGKGSEAFIAAAALAAKGTGYVANTASLVSSLVNGLVVLSKSTAGLIGLALNEISIFLMKLAAQAAVPAIGWAVAVLNAAVEINKMFGLVKLVYTALNGLYGFLVQFVDAKLSVLDTVKLNADLAEAAARATIARIA